jgi:hypothetical protein
MVKYRDDDDVVRDGESIHVPVLLMDAEELRQHRPGYRIAAHEVTDFRGLRLDTMRRTARDEYVKRTCDAWRGPGDDPDRAPLPQAPSMAAPAKEPEKPLPDPGVVEAAYQSYKRALGQAWRLSPDPCPWQTPPGDLLAATMMGRILALAPPIAKSSAPLLDPRASSEIAKHLARGAAASAETENGDARDGYIARMRDAWRPANDRAEPDISTRPEEMRAPHSESDPADPRAAKQVEREREQWLGADPKQLAADLEKKRAELDRENRSRLENAWRGRR